MTTSDKEINPFIPFSALSALARIRMVLGLVLLLALAAAAFLSRSWFVSSGHSPRDLGFFLAVFVLVLILSLVLIFLHPRLEGRTALWLNVVYLVLAPLYIFLTVEMITASAAGHTALPVRIFGPVITRPSFVFANLLLICLLLAFLILITNSIQGGCALGATLLVLFAIANLYTNNFRGAAVTAADLAVLGTAMEVAGNYVPKMHIRVFQGAANLLLFLIVSGHLGRTRLTAKGKHHALRLLGAALTGAALFAALFSGFLAVFKERLNYTDPMRFGYREYGCVFTFARSVDDAFPRKPAGYSKEAVLKIASRYESGKAPLSDGVSEQTPNILVIVNEAFSDLHELGAFETSENELSFFHSLTENCISGIAYASVKGGRTANTEYEVLTGHSMIHLPYGTVPFQLFIKNRVPSLASIYAKEDYAGIFAFHPRPKNNYNRVNAYPLLGFEAFYDDTEVPLPLSEVHQYYTDASCYDNMLSLLGQYRAGTDRPVFAYNMTIQNHSPYDVAARNFTPSVHTTGLSRSYYDVDSYLTLMKYSDEALKALIDDLKALTEPTLLLFVGDHQPSLDSGFYREVVENEDLLPDYRVPFKIWANFDIEEQSGIVTSMNYLQTYLLDALGGRRTGFQQFLTELRKDVPVITANGYMGADGTFYQLYDTASPYYERLQEYALLQYNALFDSDNLVDSFFEFE